jgi:hypothetical protein
MDSGWQQAPCPRPEPPSKQVLTRARLPLLPGAASPKQDFVSYDLEQSLDSYKRDRSHARDVDDSLSV